jgi:hypothetical protein
MNSRHHYHDDDDFADLVPAYVNGTLDAPERRRLYGHLSACPACRAELARWKAVRGATARAFGPLPAPPLGTLEKVMERVGERPGASDPVAWGFSVSWQLLAGQVALVGRGIWAASALTMALGCVVALLAASPNAAGATLALFAPAVAAFGVAFVYGPENDPSLEIALSTPTPPRLVLIARLTLVYGYDLALALVATGVLALAKGGMGLLPLVSLWIGPMLFLSALALVGSFLIGPTNATLLAMGLWATKLLAATYSGTPLAFPGADMIETFWQSEAVLLPLAALLLAGALLFAPRMAPQPERLA